jgi:hypothetical protein
VIERDQVLIDLKVFDIVFFGQGNRPEQAICEE